MVEPCLGDTFTRWTVVGSPFLTAMRGGGMRKVVPVRCQCGTEKTIRLDGLLTGRSRSCGCLHSEVVSRMLTTHGHTIGASSPTFRSWDHMIQRCTNPNFDQYHDYGGRGVRVCERWLNFDAFLEDMGERPPGTSLDRKDNGLLYSKETCRWATREEQADARRNTIWVDFYGKRVSLRQAAVLSGIKPKTLSARWYKGLRGSALFAKVGEL